MSTVTTKYVLPELVAEATTAMVVIPFSQRLKYYSYMYEYCPRVALIERKQAMERILRKVGDSREALITCNTRGFKPEYAVVCVQTASQYVRAKTRFSSYRPKQIGDFTVIRIPTWVRYYNVFIISPPKPLDFLKLLRRKEIVSTKFVFVTPCRPIDREMLAEGLK